VGRVDASGADSTTQLLGRNAGVTRQECTFANGGYTLEEMIALIGAHTIGFTRTGNPPNVVTTPLSATPVAFNNDYFTGLLTGNGVLPSDRNLLRDTARLVPLVQGYAANQASFFRDFEAAYVKMGMMGATWKSYPQS